MPEEATNENGYKPISHEIDGWLVIHKGETFDLDLVCKQLNIVHSQSRKYAAVKLNNETKAGKLEKSNRLYRYIDNDIVPLNDWPDVVPGQTVSLDWPMGTDGTRFGFDGCIEIPQRGVVVIAGLTNTGKSSFMRNLLWMNMLKIHCTYFSSETSKEDFADYASRMTWANAFDDNHKPVFDLIDRHKDFQDVIRPNDLNLIDWLAMGDKFYALGELIEKIKHPLDHGAVVIAIQKDANKELGMGGQWGEHLASLYITMDFERLTVKKAKKWCHYNPNGKTWGF